MASPVVQTEARVRMPLTRSPRRRSVPARCRAPGHPRAAAAALLRCWWRGPDPAAVVIGTAAVTTVLPEIPPETLAEWQRAVDLTARLARVPASLIMRTARPTHTVLVSSRTEGNPYAVGREYDLHAVLYCQGVFDNDGELVVEDATHDPVWAANEDLADGMRFYIGYPLKWPSGEVFGTICVLDRERNAHALLFREGLQAFAGVVEATLRSLVEIAERRRLETALQHSLDQTARQVVERTSELQDANTALRVLLGNVEQSNEARNEQLLQQINTLVMPHVAKLARLVERDRAAVEYVRLIETHLTTLTSSLSSRMARVFLGLDRDRSRRRASGDARPDHEGHCRHAVAGAEHDRLSPQQHPRQARRGAARDPARVPAVDPLSGGAGAAAELPRPGTGPASGTATTMGGSPSEPPAMFSYTHPPGASVAWPPRDERQGWDVP